MSQTAQHTPGPWHVHHGSDYLEVFADHPAKAQVIYQRRFPDGEDAANAKLIAAAPDMAEALKNLLLAYESHMHSEYDFPSDPWDAKKRGDKEVLKARAALAKAGVA